MPIVKRSKRIAGTSSDDDSSPREKIDVSLPTKPSKVSNDFMDYTVLVHGRQKIGKTTLFSGETDTFYLEFDPLQKAYSIRQRHIPDWRHFLAYLKLLEAAAEKGSFPYKAVVLDRVDLWYKSCVDWCVAYKLGGKEPGDLEGWDRANAWNVITATFDKAVLRVLALPCGKRFISHSKIKEIDPDGQGVKVNMLIPDISGSCDKLLAGRVDLLASYQYSGKRRVLVIQGDEFTSAGNRIKGHFMTPDGRRVTEIPMGRNEEEAYANLLRAFNNEQDFATLDERKGGDGKPLKNFKKKRLPR